MNLSQAITAADMAGAVKRLFELASCKTAILNRRWNHAEGAPVFTAGGRYTARAWTQWTHGFQYGNALLCYDVTGDAEMLRLGRQGTKRVMPEHLTHRGVHDHGFNTLSTYGQLRRLARSGKFTASDCELEQYELAIKVSGAVQAMRWTRLADGGGFIHSFNGPHSLFIDTLRTLRVLVMAHDLGHVLLDEQDQRVDLLQRALTHARTTSQCNIYYGQGRDYYDTPDQRGRTAHEALFNPVSRQFRAPASQQGYSPFSTWTRGLAWAMLGFAELVEFVRYYGDKTSAKNDMKEWETMLLASGRAVCDFYLQQAAAEDGICYWDTGAPLLHKLGEWQSRAAEPHNDFEPVDSSASAIAAQGLIRLGAALGLQGDEYVRAGLLIAQRLFDEPYLSSELRHEGILLHSVYHRPNGWDYVPGGSKIPCGQSSMWGDYHALELGLLIWAMGKGGNYHFYD